MVVENNTEHYTQVFYDCKLMRQPLTLTGGFVEGRVGRVIRCEQKRATMGTKPDVMSGRTRLLSLRTHLGAERVWRGLVTPQSDRLSDGAVMKRGRGGEGW